VNANVVSHALAGHDSRVSGPFDARPQMRKEVKEMKRAVTSKKTIAAMLVAAAALAGGSIAGAGHTASATHGGKQFSLCPPAC
jgi:hypothetical protein